MKAQQIFLSIIFGAMLAVTGCSDDSGSGGSAGNGGTGGTPTVDCTDDTGACCIICDGGEPMCVVDGLDPADGLDTCVTECRAQWENEATCGGDAAFVIECVDANRACDTLEDETCGIGQSSALGMLEACLEG